MCSILARMKPLMPFMVIHLTLPTWPSCGAPSLQSFPCIYWKVDRSLDTAHAYIMCEMFARIMGAGPLT